MMNNDIVSDCHHLRPPIMPLIPRRLDLRGILEQKSGFLFGPRQTGKSTLIRQQFGDCPVWNLLDQTLFLRLARNPALIREALAERPSPTWRATRTCPRRRSGSTTKS